MAEYELRLGDCIKIMPQLLDESISAVIADPPYGIDYQSARRADKETWFPKIKGDQELDFSWAKEAARIAKIPGCIFVFCRWDVQQEFFDGINVCWRVTSQIVWDRGLHGMGNLEQQYAPRHDIAWFGVIGDWKFPKHRPSSVYFIMRPPHQRRELLHPMQKPVVLMRQIVTDLTLPGDTVLDPFMGSGTTGVACMLTGRNFIGIELDETYYAIAEKRIREAQQQANGQFVTKQDDGNYDDMPLFANGDGE